MPRTVSGVSGISPPSRVLVGQEDPVVAVADADHLPAAVVRGQDDGADHGVEPGRVAAPGADADRGESPSRPGDIGFGMLRLPRP